MSKNIGLMLDKAKVIHKLPSDYKLALVMGVKQTTLKNYRDGITLPVARVISKLCYLTGDDPAILAAEIEVDRAKTEEARALWSQIARRLMAGAAAGVTAAVLSGCMWLGDASASLTVTTSSTVHSLYIMFTYSVRRMHRWCAMVSHFFTPSQNEKVAFSCA